MGKPYPLFVTLHDRVVVIVGGGSVAYRKYQSLGASGAHVTVIAPELAPEFLAQLEEDASTRVLRRGYKAGDLAEAYLVFAATNVREVNEQVATDAREAGALVCVVDKPDEGDFIVPALVRRGPLAVAISTGGASPAVARAIRIRLEEALGPEYAELLELALEYRELAQRELDDGRRRRQFLRQLAEPALLQTIRTRGADAARQALEAKLQEYK